MTIKRLFLMLVTTACCGAATAQRLTLDDCRRMAHDNYPAIRQYDIIGQSRDYDIANAAKAWLPQVSLSAGAYAFTDVIKDDDKFKMMGLDMKNHMFNASVTVRQNVYDGGKTALNRRAATAEADVQSRQLDVSMYEIYERVEQIYFSILLIDEQLKQNSTLQADLDTSMKTVESMMQGGIANQSDKDILRVEQLKAVQQHDQLTASRRAYTRILALFTGCQLGDNTSLEKPDITAGAARQPLNRPEMNLFASQEKALDLQKAKLNADLRPTVGFVGSGLWHSKVNDLMNDGLLLGGLQVSWNIGALYTRKNDLRRLEEQRQRIDSQRATFLFNNSLQNEETDGAIETLRKQLAHDDEIVSLRENIRLASEKKVELGTMSVNDLVQDINAVSMAKAQRAEHEVLLMKNICHLRTLNNLQ